MTTNSSDSSGTENLTEAIRLEKQGTAALKLERWDQAIEVYTTCLNLVQYSTANEVRNLRSKLLHNRSVCFSKKEDSLQAVEDAMNALLCRPNSKKALFRLATVRENLSDFIGAISALKRLAKLLDPKRRLEVEKRMTRLQRLADEKTNNDVIN